MSNLIKRGRFWHYDLTVDGVRHRGSTKQADKQLARAVVARFTERASRAAVYGAQEELTFKEAAKLYLQKNANDIKLVNALIAKWGHRKVASIISGEVTDLAIELYPQGMPSTRNRNVIAPVSAIINHAAKRGKAHFIRLELFKVTRPPKAAGSKEWLAAFRAACETHCKPEMAPYLKAIARFMFETAARIGQTVELEWDNVNLQEGHAMLMTRKTGANGPEKKFGKAYLSVGMVAELANLPRTRKVFGYNDRHAVTKAWAKVIKGGKLPALTRHEAGRHGFFTEFVVRNGKDVTTAAALGRGSPAVINSTYAHAEGQRDKINEVFGGK